MPKLPVLLALLLSASALAGGGGPLPDMPFVQKGQVWEMTYQPVGQQVQRRSILLKFLDSGRENQQDERHYIFTDNASESFFVLPSANLIGVSAFQFQQQPRVMCIVDYRQNPQLHGYIIAGDENLWNRYTASPENSTVQALFVAAKRDKLGTCTLKRLR